MVMKSLFFMRLTFFRMRKQAAQPCEFLLTTGRLYHAALPCARRFLARQGGAQGGCGGGQQPAEFGDDVEIIGSRGKKCLSFNPRLV